MDKELLKANRLKWLEELESGNWKQARGAWRTGIPIDMGQRHCCLDVANCVLAPNSYNGTDQTVYKEIFKGDSSLKLGIPMEEGSDTPGSFSWFVRMNDKYKLSFQEIAIRAREYWGLPKEA